MAHKGEVQTSWRPGARDQFGRRIPDPAGLKFAAGVIADLTSTSWADISKSWGDSDRPSAYPLVVGGTRKTHSGAPARARRSAKRAYESYQRDGLDSVLFWDIITHLGGPGKSYFRSLCQPGEWEEITMRHGDLSMVPSISEAEIGESQHGFAPEGSD